MNLYKVNTPMCLPPRCRSLLAFPCHCCCCCCCVAQSCPTLCHPVDGSPPGSPVPGILQARTLEWGAIAFSRHHCLPKGNRYSHVEDQVPREADTDITVQLGPVLVGGKVVGGKVVEGQGSRGKRKEREETWLGRSKSGLNHSLNKVFS